MRLIIRDDEMRQRRQGLRRVDQQGIEGCKPLVRITREQVDPRDDRRRQPVRRRDLVQPARFRQRLVARPFGLDVHARDDRHTPRRVPEIVHPEIAAQRRVVAEHEARRIVALLQPRIVRACIEPPQVVMRIDERIRHAVERRRVAHVSVPR